MAIGHSPDDMSDARRDLQGKANAQAARIERKDAETDAEAEIATVAATDAGAGRAAAEDEAIRANILAQRASAQANIASAERGVVDRELAVERRRASNYTFGFLLTAGILGAALLVGVLYTLFRPQSSDQVVVNAGTLPPGQTVTVQTTPPPANVPPSGAVVAATTRPEGTPMQRVVVTVPDSSTGVFSSNPSALVGKRLTFNVVNVESVIADRAFWVGPSTGERLLAVLDPALDNGVMERIVRVKQGQQRTMSGTLQRMPPIETARRRWKLDSGDVFDIQGQRYYVLIDRIDLR